MIKKLKNLFIARINAEFTTIVTIKKQCRLSFVKNIKLITSAAVAARKDNMDATLQADLQTVSDKYQVKFTVTVPVTTTETVEFTPNAQ